MYIEPQESEHVVVLKYEACAEHCHRCGHRKPVVTAIMIAGRGTKEVERELCLECAQQLIGDHWRRFLEKCEHVPPEGSGTPAEDEDEA